MKKALIVYKISKSTVIFIITLFLLNNSQAQIILPDMNYYVEYVTIKKFISERTIEKKQYAFIGDTSYLEILYPNQQTTIDRKTKTERIQLNTHDSSYISYSFAEDSLINQKYEKERFFNPFQQIQYYIDIINKNDSTSYRIVQKFDNQDSSYYKLSLKTDNNESDSGNQLRVLYADATISWPKDNPLLIRYTFEIGTVFGNQRDEFKILAIDTNKNNLKIKSEDFRTRFNNYFEIAHVYNSPKIKKSNHTSLISSLKDSSFLNFNGESVKLNQYHSNLFVIDFWYSSCLPCVMCFESLSKLSQKYRGRVQFIGLNPKDYPNKTLNAKKLIAKYGIQYPNIYVNDDLCNSLGITSFPTLLILDKNFTVIKTHIGNNPDFEQEIDLEIQKILKQ